MNLSKIGLVMVGVTDLARSAAFYRDTLGMQMQGEVPGEFAFFNGGGMMLALSVPHSKNRANLLGATEIVFAVDNVSATYAELRSRGVTFLNEPRVIDGVNWGANFTDPDGHWLSIFGPKGN